MTAKSISMLALLLIPIVLLSYSCGKREGIINPLIPTPPSNLIAKAISSSKIQLKWYDNSNNEEGFKIDRSLGSDGVTAFKQVATVAADTASYVDDGLLAGTHYLYRIRAYREEDDSNFSNTSGATTLLEGSTPICIDGEEITETCLCGGAEYTLGFCCLETWQGLPCDGSITTEPGLAKVSVNVHVCGKDKLRVEDGKMQFFQLGDSPPTDPTCPGCELVKLERLIDGEWWSVPQPLWHLEMDGTASNEHDMQLDGLVPGESAQNKNLEITQKNCRKWDGQFCLPCGEGSPGCQCTDIHIHSDSEIIIDDSSVCSCNNMEFNFEYDFIQISE